MKNDALMVNGYIMIIQAVLLLSWLSFNHSAEIWHAITGKISSLKKNRTLTKRKRAQEKLEQYWEIDMRKFK